jgi:hypothetical protein
MSVMSVSTVKPPPRSSLTRAADLVTWLPRIPAATPWPSSQRTLAHRARPGTAPVPAESRRARAKAADERPLRERPLRMLRIDLRVVADTELDRIEAELFRHLVDRDSSAMCPVASPGARIALDSGRSSTARRVAVIRFAPA